MVFSIIRASFLSNVCHSGYTKEWFWVLCFSYCNVILKFVGHAITLTLNHVNISHMETMKNSCVVFNSSVINLRFGSLHMKQKLRSDAFVLDQVKH